MLRRIRYTLLILIVLLAAVDGVVALDRWLRGHRADGSAAAQISPAPLAIGDPVDRAVPSIPLLDASGHSTSLAAFRGRWVVLAPSMTLCHEVCPMTTAALDGIAQAAQRAGVARRVAVVEVTVDPWRDTPGRLQAYRRLTGADFQLLTGTQAQISRVWRFFGVYYRRVPQGNPPDVDWWTGRPESFDVEHTDALFFLDPRGHLRIVNQGMPSVGGRLSPALRRLLNDRGQANLSHPQLPWTVPQAVSDLWHLMGRPVPQGAIPAPSPPPTLAAARARLTGSPAALAALHAQGARLLPGGGTALRARLAALRGHPVVINEWASWCYPCRHEFPLFAAASAAYGRRVAFLGLNVDDQPGAARAFLGRQPLSYPSYSDSSGTVAQSLASLEGLPTTVFVDARGETVFAHAGGYESEASLANDIQRYALGASG